MEYFLKRRNNKITTRHANFEDEWDRGNTKTIWEIEDVLYEFEEGDNFRFSDYSRPEPLDPKEDAYVLYAIWSTGDSFGHDEDEMFEVLYVGHDQVEAIDMRRDLYNEKEDLSIDFRGRSISLPWNGYFENLTEIELLRVWVRQHEPNDRYLPW